MEFVAPRSLSCDQVMVAMRQLRQQLVQLHSSGYTKGPIQPHDIVRVQGTSYHLVNFASCAQAIQASSTWLPMRDHQQALDPAQDFFKADFRYLGQFLTSLGAPDPKIEEAVAGLIL